MQETRSAAMAERDSSYGQTVRVHLFFMSYFDEHIIEMPLIIFVFQAAHPAPSPSVAEDDLGVEDWEAVGAIADAAFVAEVVYHAFFLA